MISSFVCFVCLFLVFPTLLFLNLQNKLNPVKSVKLKPVLEAALKEQRRQYLHVAELKLNSHHHYFHSSAEHIFCEIFKTDRMLHACPVSQIPPQLDPLYAAWRGVCQK